MDYFQGVVTDFLRAKRSQFVNTEYMINLDSDGSYKKDRHWFCDVVAFDFADNTVQLCEITYSKNLHSLGTRLQAWADHWSDLVISVRRDSSLQGEWRIFPRIFVPDSLRHLLEQKTGALRRPESSTLEMPDPVVTPLEEVLPWRYRSWDGRPYKIEDGD